MSNFPTGDASEPESDEDHLEDLEDGAGATEIWEHLTLEPRDAASDDE